MHLFVSDFKCTSDYDIAFGVCVHMCVGSAEKYMKKEEMQRRLIGKIPCGNVAKRFR